MLNHAFNEGKLPRVPVFVDSPLSINATMGAERYPHQNANCSGLDSVSNSATAKRKDALRSVEDGKVRMPFSAMPGVGENAAIGLQKAREDGGPAFSSIEDFAARSGASSSVIAALKAGGAFGDLPDSDQMSFFDM